MIIYIREKDLEICLEKELSSSDVVLYKIDIESNSDIELVLNDESCPTTPQILLINIILGDAVGKKTI